jgi:hypothetical protein
METSLSRLVEAMMLALTAPVGREHDADDLVQSLAAGLSDDDIDVARGAALYRLWMLESELAQGL